MFDVVLIITAVYFVIGAIAILIIGKRSDPARRRQLWLKYGTYLVIVCGILFSTLNNKLFFWLCMGLVLGGSLEMLLVFLKSRKTGVFVTSLLPYFVFAVLFMQFASVTDPAMHLYVYAIVFVFDGFSQLSGQLFGRRKLSPSISPNKTIAGFFGGLVMAVATGFLLQYRLSAGLFFSAFSLALASLAGDLLASWYKRLNGVKDYSNYIPGHGGILDRFDSFIAAGALSFLLI
ncbi:MAG: phosphatidate cytidylyltransferase [Bacteroidia bacterium]